MSAKTDAAYIIDNASTEQRVGLRKTLKVSRLTPLDLIRFFYTHELKEMAQQIRREGKS